MSTSQQQHQQQPSPTHPLSHPPQPVLISQQEQEERERDELTTKGRKRKRLAKACSACHKNKRRCDGFAPCSNCEFSARTCLYLNSAGEPIPPPRTRDSSVVPGTPNASSVTPIKKASNGPGPSRLSNIAIAPAGMRRASHSDGERDKEQRDGDGQREREAEYEREREKRERERSTRPHVVDIVDRDAVLSAELLQLFFDRLPPFSTMFHPPTFYHRHYLGLVPSYLLDAIFALSARLSDDLKLIPADVPDAPVWSRGEAFAERAQYAIEKRVEERRLWSDEERRRDVGTWEETEFAQANCLLSFYHTCLRSPRLALTHMDIGIATLHPTIRLSPPSQYGLSPLEQHTLRETRTRTLWVLFLHDCCAAANGRPRRLLDHEMRGIPLPGNEAAWTRWGGVGAGRTEPRRRDGLEYETGDWPGEDGEIGEIGHVLRILAIFGNIMAVSNNGGAGNPDARTLPVQYHERALKTWAVSLPTHLQFNEVNLRAAMKKLESPLAPISGAGWMYAYMHTLAECGMFYLQVVAATSVGTVITAQRQAQAVDNLSVIVNTLGQRGRESPLMLFPLTVIANWVDHLRTSQGFSSPQHQIMEERLHIWWGEANRLWGLERDLVLDKGFYPVNRHDRRSSGSQVEYRPYAAPGHRGSLPSPQSAGPRSQQQFADEQSSLGLYHAQSSGSSSTGSSHLITPGTASSSRSAPIRQRAGSISTKPQTLLPSPPRRDSRPSTEMPKMALPPYQYSQTQRDNYSPRQTGARYSPDRELQRDRRSSAAGSFPPRHQPYARPVENGHKPREASPSRQWETSREGAQCLGIAALVSAAEERSKERLFAPPSEVTKV